MNNKEELKEKVNSPETEEQFRNLMKKDFYKNVFKRYFLFSKVGFGPVFNFVMLVIAVFAIALAAPGSMYVTIPFILIPALFAVTNFYLQAQYSKDEKQSFFRSLMTYFSPRFYGCYRLILTFFLGLIVATVCSSIVGQIYYRVVVGQDPTFADKFATFTTILYNGNRGSALAMLENDDDLLQMFNVIMISSGFSFYMYSVHKISQKVMYIFIRLFTPVTNNKIQNRLSTIAIKDANPEYRRTYWKGMWPLLLVELAGLAGGYAIAWILPFNPQTKIVFATGFTTLLLALLLPYYMACQVTTTAAFSFSVLKNFLSKNADIESFTITSQPLETQISKEDEEKAKESSDELLKQEKTDEETVNKEIKEMKDEFDEKKSKLKNHSYSKDMINDLKNKKTNRENQKSEEKNKKDSKKESDKIDISKED